MLIKQPKKLSLIKLSQEMLKLIKFFRCHNSQTLMKKLTEGDMQERGDISNNGKQTDLKKKGLGLHIS